MADDDQFGRSLSTLGLSPRAMQLLDARGIRSVGELVKLGRAGCMAIPGFGRTSLRSVREGLRRIGLGFTDDA